MTHIYRPTKKVRSFRPSEYGLSCSKEDLKRYRLNVSGYWQVRLLLDKLSDNAIMDPGSKVTPLPNLYNRRMKMTSLIPALMGKCAEFGALLQEGVFKKVFAALEAALLTDGPFEGEVKRALESAVAEASTASEWKAILDTMRGAYHFVCQMSKEFCERCEIGALAEFLVSENGFAEGVLFELVTSQGPLERKEIDEIHFVLSGLTRLVEHDGAYRPLLLEVVALCDRASAFRGGEVEGLQKRFDGIRARFTTLVPPASKPTVQPSAKPQGGRRDPAWAGNPTMAAALAGVKVGGSAAA